MTVKTNRAVRLCFAGPALGGLIAFAFVPAATAQWLPPPWRAAFPGEIARSLEAQGYVLTGPLMRRPGVYVADVSAGPAGSQRLIIDARSGAILERFPAPSRIWGPALAARDEGFEEPPPPWAAGPPSSLGVPSAPRPAAAAKSAYGGPANVHIPAAISPYDAGEAPAGTKPKPKSVSAERKPPASKAPIVNPPLPPPAPREPAKPDGSGWPAPPAGSTEVDNALPGAAPAAPGSSVEASDKPKVSVVPPAPFE
jgi:hypothetical protein